MNRLLSRLLYIFALSILRRGSQSLRNLVSNHLLKIVRLAFTSACVLALSIINVNSQTTTWQPIIGGSWTTGANWSNGVPGVGYDVIINSDQSGDITDIPTISLNSLTISGNCLLAGAGTPEVLTITGSYSISAGKTVTTGLDGSGNRINTILTSTCIGTISGTLIVASGGVSRFLQNDGDLTIASTGTVTDTNVVGVSNFILSGGATLRIGSSVGIGATGGGATGNIQVTGTRTYSTGANYIYNGTSNQGVGNGLPATLLSLAVANSGGVGSNSVTIASPIIITGTTTVTSGILDANGQTITVTGLTSINGGSYLASTATQTFNGGLTIAGGTFTGSTGAVTTTNIALNSGTLIAPSGVFSVSGNWSKSGGTFTPGANTVAFTSAGTQTLNSGASSFNDISHTGSGTLQLLTNALTTGGAFINSAGTFDANGLAHTVTGVATVSAGTYFAKSATQTFNSDLGVSGIFTGSTGDVLIAGNLSIGNGGAYTQGASNLTVSGTTTVGNGVSGNLILSSSTGTKTFTGLVVIATGATWNNSGNSAVTFQGGITKSGSGAFTSGTGLHTFDTNSQSLTGIFSIPDITIIGVSLANNNTLDVGTALSGSGFLTQSTNATLNLLGTSAISSINATNTGNTINFNGAAQIINSGSFYNLTINQTGGTDANLGGAVLVNRTLTLSNGKIITGASTLSMSSGALAIVGASTSKFINGNLEWTLPAGASSRVFEIGSAVYAPVTLNSTAVVGIVNITASTLAGAVPTENTPLANSSGINQSNKVDQYWSLTKTGAGTFNSNPTFDFSNTLNTGISANYKIRKYDVNPTFWTATPSLVAGNTISTTGGLTSLSDFEIGELNAAPTVSNPANVLVCEGGMATFTVVATGTPAVTYQWRKGVVNISGANATTYTINPVTLADAASYDCVVTNINGTATSAVPASLTVNPLPTLSAILQTVSVCDGNVATIDLTGLLPSTTSTIAYTINGIAQASIVGVVSNGSGIASFTTPVLTFANDGQVIQITGITVTSAVPNCVKVFTTSTTLSVNPLPNTLASNETICSGTTTSIAITTPNGVAGTTYTWIVQSNPGLVTGATAGSGATIGQTLVNPSNVQQTVTYRITPRSGVGCNGATFDVSALVDPTPDISAAPASQVICSGTATSIALSNPNAVAGTQYFWTVVQSNVTGASNSGTLAAPVSGPIIQTLTASSSAGGTATYTITPVVGAAGCPGIAVIATVSVNEIPNASASPQTICSGATSSVSITNPNLVTGTTFTWTAALLSGSPTGFSNGSGATISQSLSTNNLAGTVRYTITPSANGCAGSAITVDVLVNPVPTASANNQVICSGTATSIALSNPNAVAGTQYFWTVVQSNVTGASNSGTLAAPVSGPIIQTLTASSSAGGTATYTITPVVGAAGCPGIAVIATVSVNAIPNAAASPQTICSGATSSVAITNPNAVTGTTFTWTAAIQSGSPSGFTYCRSASICKTCR